LFLLGQRDIMTPPKAAAGLIAAIKHAKVAQVEASGHALMAEQPDELLDHLFTFATAAIED
jgi:pimeloyl-ACP methyl ester carboxylesterase